MTEWSLKCEMSVAHAGFGTACTVTSAKVGEWWGHRRRGARWYVRPLMNVVVSPGGEVRALGVRVSSVPVRMVAVGIGHDDGCIVSFDVEAARVEAGQLRPLQSIVPSTSIESHFSPFLRRRL